MFYTEVQNAKSALLDRKDKVEEVELYWRSLGFEIPIRFHKPTLVLGRPACLNIEALLALQIAREAGLDSGWLTYDKDKYTNISSLKRSLVQPLFTERLDKLDRFIPKKEKLIKNLNILHGLKLIGLTSDEGHSVLDFHRARLLSIAPNVQICDMSEWANKLGGAKGYYEAYLSLFVAHAILIEEYHNEETGEGNVAFAKNVFEPAFQNVVERFGARPIIIRLPCKPHYEYYPKGEMMERWEEIILPRL